MPPKKLKTYVLAEPLIMDKETIKEVTIHPLKTKDLVAAEKELMALNQKEFSEVGNIERQACLIARMIRLPQPDVNELSAADYTGLLGFLS